MSKTARAMVRKRLVCVRASVRKILPWRRALCDLMQDFFIVRDPHFSEARSRIREPCTASLTAKSIRSLESSAQTHDQSAQVYFASSQFGPVPRSATRGTSSLTTFSIVSFTIFPSHSTSDRCASKTNSSCTWRAITDFFPLRW